MNRRDALACLCSLASACRRAPKLGTLPPGLAALLQVGSDFGEHDGEAAARAASELRQIATRVGSAKNSGPIAALNQVIFGTLGFAREIVDTDLSFVLLPGVLRQRRGSCVGLSSLYLALAELLGVTCSGVLLPGHFFVRIEEGGRVHNVELLRRGEELPESWYRERYPIPGGPAPAYERGLSSSEVQGVVEFDIGNQRKRKGRLQEARRAYQRAAQHFPDFAEAHASLGTVLHLLGQLDAAEAAYRMALQKQPSLPGLANNFALLEQERTGAQRSD